MSKPKHHLHCTVQHASPGLSLEVDLHLSQDWTILFGPSGAGKSSILRLIAGLERFGNCFVQAGEDVLTDTTHRIFVPPHMRRIRFVAQEGVVFPHMLVRENVEFGLQSAGVQTTRREERVQAALRCFRIEHLAERQTIDDSALYPESDDPVLCKYSNCLKLLVDS